MRATGAVGEQIQGFPAQPVGLGGPAPEEGQRVVALANLQWVSFSAGLI